MLRYQVVPVESTDDRSFAVQDTRTETLVSQAMLRGPALRRAFKYNTLEVSCPNCQAPQGVSCTRPTITGRRDVSWFHTAREDAAGTVHPADV